MLAHGFFAFSLRGPFAARLTATFAGLLDVLRRIWTVLKERLAPREPVPVPIRIRHR